jgi:glycosyltransferase involved in cell wall biosynthesis
LYIHSSSSIIKHSYCFPIEELICNLEISNEEIIINKKTFTEEKIAELYKLSDIYLCNSKAEGFGVPIIEGQLYNTNVITGNFLSMNEHNFQKNITEISTEVINYDLNGIWILPSTVSIFNKIEEVYLNNNEEKIKKANWIISNLTSFNNIKKNLYKILMDT